MSEIIIYEDGNIELPISFDEKSNVQKMHIATQICLNRKIL